MATFARPPVAHHRGGITADAVRHGEIVAKAERWRMVVDTPAVVTIAFREPDTGHSERMLVVTALRRVSPTMRFSQLMV